MDRTKKEIYIESINKGFIEIQKKNPYMTLGQYQRLRLLFGIDKVIIEI